MRPLHDAQRRRLLTWSAILCAIPLCLAPLAGRSSFELAGEQAAIDARFSTPGLEAVWSGKPVDVARDPFMPEGVASSPPLVPAAQDNVVGLQVTQGQPTGFVLPANSGATGTPIESAALGAAVVTAIVTGPSPRALVDDGAHVRVVGIGDLLAGSRVAAIDDRGVHLQNGSVMGLVEDTP